MYAPVENKPDFNALDHDVLKFWSGNDIFEQSLSARNPAAEYVFYDGPPFATGRPHYGHLLAGTIKDIVPRYQTMRGRTVRRRFGWDCHGLPIEALAQEALGLQGAAEIRARGVSDFNAQCRSMVLRYVDEWRRMVTRMGRWVDFEDDYKTMDPDFMESVWWVFKQLWDRDRIYRSYRIMPYSARLNTPLSNFEAGRNYRQVQDPSVTVRLRITDPPAVPALADGESYLLVWTTTPWTLPGNLAVCAGPSVEYLCVRDPEDGGRYVLAAARLEALQNGRAPFEVLARCPGRALAGCGYAPLFPDFASQPNAFRVLLDDFVSTGEGTGLVHMAPAYGEDDFRVCSQADIALVDYLDESCIITDRLPAFAGQFCKDADKAILRHLKREGHLVRHETVEHSYPFCERTDTPLIYRAIEAWYLRVEDIRDRLITANAAVRWMPEHVGEKRFANWLQEARDWNISRNRFWGSCIPVWVSEDGSDAICVGSVAELEALSGMRVTDLHKHVVDDITFVRNGRRYRRTPEVLDCWFESGAMPLAQQHYPFERSGELDAFFPADFIAEGLDQTRGWFYTLLVLAVQLFDRVPYRNVVVNGLVLAADGKKMSKRLQNYPDPTELIEKYGADALRLYMMASPVVRAENLRFEEDGVKHVLRSLLIPWWNAYSFFVTYANIDGWAPGGADGQHSDNPLDGWIESALASMVAEVTAAMDAYDLQRAVRPLVEFVESLTNGYIRRSRRRFWKSRDDDDKQSAYRTLHKVLVQLSQAAAPFVPFISESMYRNLRHPDMPVSVHLCTYPEPETAARNPELEAQMRLVQRVVRMGRQLRTDHELKVRQPLTCLHVVSSDPETLARIGAFESIILDELNIKQARYERDETIFARREVKPDYRRLGPRLGARMQAVSRALAALPAIQIEALAAGRAVTLSGDAAGIRIAPEDVTVVCKPREKVVVAVEEGLMVAIETALTEPLLQEGLAREFVSRVQGMRKTAALEVTQRIEIAFASVDAVAEAVETHRTYVRAETLAQACRRVDAKTLGTDAAEWNLNGHPCRIAIRPAAVNRPD